MVLCGFGSNCTEADVRRLIGSSRLGVSLAAAATRLGEEGAKIELHSDWNIDDLRDALRAGLAPIAGVERYPLGYASSFHAIVLVNLGGTTITAMDPLEGPGPRNYGPRAFELAWEMAGREVLVIEQPPLLP